MRRDVDGGGGGGWREAEREGRNEFSSQTSLVNYNILFGNNTLKASGRVQVHVLHQCTQRTLCMLRLRFVF